MKAFTLTWKKLLLPLLALALLAGLAPGAVRAQALSGTFTVGFAHSLSIRADGSLWATGSNQFGQLGVGTTGNATSTDTWTRVGTATDWVQVGAGVFHSLALTADGRLYAWGRNDLGQLGLGTNLDTNAPTLVLAPAASNANPGSHVWARLVAGRYHSLALTADGRLYTWGNNQDGQLGLGTYASTNAPGLVSAASPWAQVVSGAYHTLALRADGTAYAWGYNGEGELGTGTGSNSSVPVPVSGSDHYTQLAAGLFHSLARRPDGTLVAWGLNDHGQLGTGTLLRATVPTPAGGGQVYGQLAAGEFYSLGLRPDGTAWAWGQGGDGQLGTGSFVDQPTPAPVSGAGGYAQVSAGEYACLGLRADGLLAGWGDNSSGQLGLGPGIYPAVPTTGAGTALPTRSTAAGAGFGLAVKADGSLWAWGDNTYGQLGQGTSGPGTGSQRPVRIGTARDWVLVAAGQQHALALKADGTAYAWGDNTFGQLGDGTTNQRLNPVAVGGGGIYTQLVGSLYHSLGQRADGTAWAWGYNSSGQLGDGTTTDRASPTAVRGGGLYTQLAAGQFHGLGLRADGSADAWGNNFYGQLGDGTTTPRLSPVAVSGSGIYTQLAASFYHSLGRRADGTADAWGYNGLGQLGDGTTTDHASPTAVGGGGTYTQLAAGRYHSLGLRADGTAYLWGGNANGQLGDGTTTDRATPTREATLGTGWTGLSAGPGFFSLARDASGLRFDSTGQNTSGQLGDGTLTLARRFDRLSPLTSFQPLPVQLVSFEARRAGPALVRLAWATASETANAGFGVERSADGFAFQRLAFVAGAGTSVVGHTYAFEDTKSAAAAYYRLAQTDLGGAVTYSPVRFVGAGEASAGLVLVPNPAAGGRVEVLGAEAGADIRVYDALGRLVRTGGAGLDTGGLRPGVYVVRAGARAAKLVVE